MNNHMHAVIIKTASPVNKFKLELIKNLKRTLTIQTVLKLMKDNSFIPRHNALNIEYKKEISNAPTFSALYVILRKIVSNKVTDLYATPPLEAIDFSEELWTLTLDSGYIICITCELLNIEVEVKIIKSEQTPL